MKKINQQWGTHLYRLFLLVIMFGVLWQKGYLWSAFLMALLLFLADTLFFPIVRLASNVPPEYPAPRRSRQSRQALPPSPAQADADSPNAPAGGGDDFREPMPGRSSPRRKGS